MRRLDNSGPIWRGGIWNPKPGRWSPAQLAGLTAWYDPSDLTTLYQDAAGTTPVTAAGQPVGRMLDKSGNGYHLRQTVAAARPTYQTDGELHWLSYDGVDDTLTCPTALFSVRATFGLSFRQLAWAGSFANLAQFGVDMPRIYLAQAAPNQLREFWGTSFVYIQRAQSYIDIGPTSLVTTLDEGVGRLYSGSQSATVSGVVPNPTAGSILFGSSSFRGRVFSGVYHSGPADTQTREQLTAYINAKAGVQI